jgi:hypothetical protein
VLLPMPVWYYGSNNCKKLKNKQKLQRRIDLHH